MLVRVPDGLGELSGAALGWDGCVEFLASYAQSETGRAWLRELVPSTNMEWIGRQHALVEESRLLLTSGVTPAVGALFDATEAVARARLGGVARGAPVVRTETFSRRAGRGVRLKAGNLQRTGCGRSRGACNTISTLAPERQRAGVGAASAGSHDGAPPRSSGRTDGGATEAGRGVRTIGGPCATPLPGPSGEGRTGSRLRRSTTGGTLRMPRSRLSSYAAHS